MQYSNTELGHQILSEFEKQCAIIGRFQALEEVLSFLYTQCHGNPDLVVDIYQGIFDLLSLQDRVLACENIAWFSLHKSIPDYHLHRRCVDEWWRLKGAALVSDVKPAAQRKRARRDRRLRIGFVGAGLTEHHHYFDMIFAPTLRALSRDVFAVHLYIENANAIDDNMSSCVETIRAVGDIDQAVWEIAADDLDVLFWPIGFTAAAPFRLMRARPARRIALWMHTYSTFGPELVDASVIDCSMVTPIHFQIQHEAVIQSAGPTVLFGASRQAPAVSPAPRLMSRDIVFGAFNRASKITRDMVKSWKEILRSVPRSKILIANQSYQITGQKNRVLKLFEDEDFDSDRVEFAPVEDDVGKYLELYAKVDIALDTAPFNGGVTTLDAMWQGVPVVTLSQPEPHGCIGESFLHSINRPDLVTRSHEDYVARAVALLDDPVGLDTWRRESRGQVQHSPLMLPGDFADRFAATVRSVLAAPSGPERADGAREGIERDPSTPLA